MDRVVHIFTSINLLMRETALLAATGFCILKASDLIVDATWLMLRVRRARAPLPRVADLPKPHQPGMLAVFVPAWDESVVIADMLRNALRVWGAGDYRLYVGCYPNDPATVAAVQQIDDARVRLVIGAAPGPTTKADCLNRLWDALLLDEAACGRRAKAVILHDAEDLVSGEEMRIFDSAIERHDFVQLPVHPLIHPQSRLVGGYYADEFAEAHGKELPVRQWLGAGLPSAGVGCAFSRDILERIARSGSGRPFDAASLTEDYELGLKVREAGGTSLFLLIAGADGRTVATREYFPGTVAAAVAQKARWMAGIALAGWDRMGWSGGLAERWMRLRDRQSLLAAAFLFAGYGALILWLVLAPLHFVAGIPRTPFSPVLASLVKANLAILAWRMAMRAGFTGRAYGWREAFRSALRAPIANAIAMLAAAAALSRYRRLRRTGRAPWGKTAHIFPATAVAAE